MRIYSLSWSAEEKSIIVKVDPEASKEMDLLLPAAPVIPSMIEDLKLPEFHYGKDGSWGFGGIMQRGQCPIGVDLMIYKAPLPEYKNVKCDICNGSGVREYADIKEECFHCGGTGIAPGIQWKEIMRLRASLQTLFRVCDYLVRDKPDDEPLIQIEMSVSDARYHAGAVGGKYSAEFCAWLKAQGGEEDVVFDDAREAIYQAWDVLGRAMGSTAYYIKVYTRYGGLTIDIPGNATGIYARSRYEDPEMEIWSHNMDSGFQQLAVLVGLAAMQDCYERSLLLKNEAFEELMEAEEVESEKETI